MKDHQNIVEFFLCQALFELTSAKSGYQIFLVDSKIRKRVFRLDLIELNLKLIHKYYLEVYAW